MCAHKRALFILQGIILSIIVLKFIEYNDSQKKVLHS